MRLRRSARVMRFRWSPHHLPTAGRRWGTRLVFDNIEELSNSSTGGRREAGRFAFGRYTEFHAARCDHLQATEGRTAAPAAGTGALAEGTWLRGIARSGKRDVRGERAGVSASRTAWSRSGAGDCAGRRWNAAGGGAGVCADRRSDPEREPGSAGISDRGAAVGSV